MKTASTGIKKPRTSFAVRNCHICSTEVLSTNRGKKQSICYDCHIENMKSLAKIHDDEREELESYMGYH